MTDNENNIEKMKTGVELIAEERREQIEKHGFCVIEDAKYYQYFELIQAALFCIDQATEPGYGLDTNIEWPAKWGMDFREKITKKDKIGKLKVAGALIAAEIDRLQAGLQAYSHDQAEKSRHDRERGYLSL